MPSDNICRTYTDNGDDLPRYTGYNDASDAFKQISSVALICATSGRGIINIAAEGPTAVIMNSIAVTAEPKITLRHILRVGDPRAEMKSSDHK